MAYDDPDDLAERRARRARADLPPVHDPASNPDDLPDADDLESTDPDCPACGIRAQPRGANWYCTHCDLVVLA
jgi:hypothetical protein